MKLATIEEIKELVPHPNADTLSLAKVLGYEVIVKNGMFKKGDLVVFIQPDSVLPDAEWAAMYKAKSSRVKAIKLRGSWSFGIAESLSILPPEVIVSFLPIGQDVSGVLGITHYEQPIPQDLSARGVLPFGMTKTDEENYQNLEVLPFGELVDVTLKIDGSNINIYCKKTPIEWITGVTSRTLDLKPECVNKYTVVVEKLNIAEKLKAYCIAHDVSLALRGEMYGLTVQKNKNNPHSTKPLSVAVFSTLNLDTLKYEGTTSSMYYENIATKLGIEMVPMLEKGVELTPALIKKYDEELTVVNNVPFEGVVIKRSNGESFKIKNKHYDAKNHD